MFSSESKGLGAISPIGVWPTKQKTCFRIATQFQERNQDFAKAGLENGKNS